MQIYHFIEFSVSNGTQVTIEVHAPMRSDAFYLYCKARRGFFRPMQPIAENIILVKVR